ncbi:MAG: quinone-dependent dihydroorotate dehydrogenase [Alphaproteobacteria bacterium]|nr:quinone-dependent dihydroorotate dehydrogenase [Alphaproteobacteria bacterium]
MIDLTWPVIRALLFQLDAERAHELTLHTLSAAPDLLAAMVRPFTQCPAQPIQIAGLTFRGPVGLAAGLDKNGLAIPFWPALGFGFVEVGTVTAHPQPGNDKPRLHRLVADRAIINRMGFNNEGSAALADRLRKLRESGRWPEVPVGANIGKSKITPLDEANADYVTSTERLRGLADWFTVNVSSPNTPGLRSLQGRDTLATLLPAVLGAAGDTPVFLKLAPDLEPEALEEAVDLAIEVGVHGLIATNTTIGRDGLSAPTDLEGGLSGRPLWPLARKRIETVVNRAGGRVPVIGVGGVERADQVRELLALGCRAVQLYTSFIFEGPGLPSRLHRELA